ncbi:uncharacterized protein LOC135845720 isoform X3 [Planococcus citri]|uniref:uncharacterized protein LOC135845720 isoform X3 n=1 Tax=Planococcus citri TaxID=170843 RepID=UPI0031F813DB
MNYIALLIFMVGILARTGYGNFSSTKPQHREHKIHNIVLYPDKHSWCKTTAIVQVVGHPGCSSVKMDNNVCVGTCFSYIVPRTVPDTPGDVLPYCDSCQPGHTTWKKVTLECTEGNFKNQNLTKYVEYIHDCNCGSCKDQSIQKLPSEEDLEGDEFDSGLITDTFNVTIDGLQLQSNNSGNSSQLAPERVSSLLKKLNNEDVNVLENSADRGLHKSVWKKLLQKMETINDGIDSAALLQQVKALEEELNIKFNYKRLKLALFKLKKYQDITRANNKPDNSSIVLPQLLQHQETFKPEENTTTLPVTVPKDSKDVFLSGLYSKLSPNLPTIGIENETGAPMIDVASQFLKPATGGSVISYHDNLEGPNHKIDKKDKLLIN